MPKRKKVVPRFGIGEWYGLQFSELDPEKRREFAHIGSKSTKQPCPFRQDGKEGCTKAGGVCSLQLHDAIDDYSASGIQLAKPNQSPRGLLRITCPY